MNTLEHSIRENSIKSGLLLGIILVALSILSFYFITVINQSPVWFVAAPLIFSVVFPIILVLIFCFYGRKKIGGYWNFKQATTGMFIMFLSAYLIQTLGRDLIFARIVEPHMIEKTEAAFLRASDAIRKQAGTDLKSMDKNVADIKKNFDDQKNVTIGKTIQGIAISIIFIFVLSLIFGGLFKKDPPYTTV